MEAISPLQRLAGGHRWQRVPPTEKRGRVQTSTVTVAVLRLSERPQVVLDDRDIDEDTITAGGAGGQHQNVTESAVRLRHKPSGIIVSISTRRSQHRNRALAREILAARLDERATHQAHAAANATRREMVGSGQRGDKVMTYRVRQGVVLDHRSGRKLRLCDVLEGRINE